MDLKIDKVEIKILVLHQLFNGSATGVKIRRNDLRQLI